MATFKDWVEGARLRTLPAAAAPVLIGAGAAARLNSFHLSEAALAMCVALMLQIGVNYANDYSDGIRGTDDIRTGPPRLTGGGLASPKTVFTVMVACFALAGMLGLILLWISHSWWLLIPGVAAVIAAWFYTGGKHPYGYMGLGEVFVFVFFGLFATVGTTWVQAHQAPWWLWVAASGMGFYSCALLMVNNLRDIPTDKESGKKTLAVRLGDKWARVAFLVLVVLGAVCTPFPLFDQIWVGFVVAVLLLLSVLVARPVWTGAQGRDLILVLRNTGLLTLFAGVFVTVFLASLAF